MATFNFFDSYAANLQAGVHDDLSASGNTLKVYLTNTAPNAATMTVKADLAEITAQNGYPAGGADLQNDQSQTGGQITVTAVDHDFVASGGSFGPFRYAVVYDDTPTSPADPLIGWWDRGQSDTCIDGDKATVDVGASLLTIG